MRAWTAERLGAIAGVGFIVLTVIGDTIGGSPPGTDDSAATIASFFQQHHRAVVLNVILTGAGAALFMWLVAAIALQLRAVGQAGWAAVAFALGVSAAALGIVSDAIYGALARIGTGGDLGLIRGLYQLDGFVTVKSFWLAAVAILAVGMAAWTSLPRWYAAVSLGAAVLSALGGIAVKQSGFLAPLGGLTLIAFLAILVWVLGTSYIVWRGSEAAGVEVRQAPAMG